MRFWDLLGRFDCEIPGEDTLRAVAAPVISTPALKRGPRCPRMGAGKANHSKCELNQKAKPARVRLAPRGKSR